MSNGDGGAVRQIVIGEYCCKCDWQFPENRLAAHAIGRCCPNPSCLHMICGSCGLVAGVAGVNEKIAVPRPGP